MADSNVSPCKVSFDGSFRRFLIGRPAKWKVFEDKVRALYGLPFNAALDVQYKDEEGDIIKLNTDSELEDVLAMHALFNSQIAAVKFEVSALFPDSVVSSIPSTRTSSIIGGSSPRLTFFTLSNHNQHYGNILPSDISSTAAATSIDTPLNRPHLSSISMYGSDHSDDVSLIELEDGTESCLGDELHRTSLVEDMDQTITYPQRALEEAARHQEDIDKMETYKLDAPVFPSSVMGSKMTTNEGYNEDDVAATETLAGSTHSTEVEPEMDTSQALMVAAAVEHYETLASRSQQSMSDEPSVLEQEFEAMRLITEPEATESIAASIIDQRTQDEISSVGETNEQVVSAPELFAEQSVPSTSTASTSTASASTSTSERNFGDTEKALIDQFQMLIKEFQDIIKSNPQLVALAGNIMNKIMSNAKVNVESFASYLQAQAQAQVAAQSAQQAAEQAQEKATQATAQTQEAASQVQETAFQASRGHPFFGHRLHHHQSHQNVTSFANAHPRSFVPPHQSQHDGFHGHGSGSFSQIDPAVTLGRSNTIHGTTPSPFSRGFPFNHAPPVNTRTYTFKSGCPAPSDTETASLRSSSSIKVEKSRAVDVEGPSTAAASGDQVPPSGSSAMPGSFPTQHPQMSELKAGWSWSRLPDDGSEHHQPPSTRAKYGWVWSDIGGEKAELEVDPVPLYTDLTEATPGSFPNDPESSSASLNRSCSTRYSGQCGSSSQEDADETLKRSHTFNGHRAERYREVAAAQVQRHRDAIEQQRIALEEQRSSLEKLRAQLAEQQVEQMASRVQPMSHRGAFRFTNASFSNASSVSSTATTDATTNTTAMPIGGGSLANIRPSAFGSSSSSTIDPIAVDATGTPGGSPQTPPVEDALVDESSPAVLEVEPTATSVVDIEADMDLGPFTDPYEFKEELAMIIAMGFPDNEELRNMVQDLGGEVEAIVECLVSQ
ncbi:hypothetical protein BG011_008385 [Mortierella polycephala]|uniref:UBA domain-containing protein n=1 Tax=Mortierella polycephala TaxID=41804 RepID=A0A9P6PN35_9FUNG|nr:hypothetical protein BG011_008385 [Mortierella polycephala]